MRSIQRFQTGALVLGVIAVIGAGMAVHYVFMRHALYVQFDSRLATKAMALANLLSYEAPGIEFELTPEMIPEFSRDAEPEYFDIIVNETRLAASDTLGSKSLIARETDGRGDGKDRDAVRTRNITLPDGRSGRVFISTFDVPIDDEAPTGTNAPQARIAVAVGRAELEHMLGRLILGDLVFAAMVIVTLFGLTWWTIRQAMRPLRRLSAETSTVNIDSLSHRFDVGTLPVELQNVGRALNALLDRIETGFARERRTTANMAHELRTPIAELRMAVEVALRWSDDSALLRQAVSTAQQISVQMGRIVDTLLTMARVQTGEAQFLDEVVGLAPLVDRLWSLVQYSAGERRVTLRVDCSPNLAALVSSDALELIVADLLSNAVEHAPYGSEVRVVAAATTSLAAGSEQSNLSSAPGTISFVVANPAGALCESDLVHVSEPFWTRDEARSDRNHTGLGLTLVQSIADAARIPIATRIESGEFRVELRLMRADPERMRTEAPQSRQSSMQTRPYYAR